MLKTCGSLTRFMDGLGLNLTADFIYLKDISDKVRIGEPAFHVSHDIQPAIEISDVITGKTLRYEGDYLKLDHRNSRPFVWFPSIKEAGVLHDSFNNDLQRSGEMTIIYKPFLQSELFYEIAMVDLRSIPIGEKQRKRMIEGLFKTTFLYAHSLQMLYCAINGNRDYLLLSHGLTQSNGTQIPTLDIDVTGTSTIYGLLTNPEIRKHLTDGEVVSDGVHYDTPEKIMKALIEQIPARVLEKGYHEFRAEGAAKKKLEVIRAENPKSLLEERMKAAEPNRNKVYTIRFDNPEMDLEIINKA